MLNFSTANKLGTCQTLKKYKGFQGTVKSLQLTQNKEKTGYALISCGLDRHMRVHSVEKAQLMAKMFLKSRMNCMLYSTNDPVSVKKSVDTQKRKLQDDDEVSDVNSEDLGTEDIWSDMETIIDEHPTLQSDESKETSDSTKQSDDEFKKPL